MNKAIVLVVHGSRIPESKRVYEELAKKVERRAGCEVEIGYMMHWQPTIEEAVNSFVKKGVKKIVMVPLFFVPGLHVTKDIPALLGLSESEEQKKIELPEDVEIIYTQPFGEDERLVDVVLDRAREALADVKAQQLPLRQQAAAANGNLAARGEKDTREIGGEGAEITRESFRIIEEKLGHLRYPESEVIKRVVHTTAEPEFAKLLVFSSDAIKRGVEALRRGANIITDVNMVKAGINTRALAKFKGIAKCFIAEDAVWALAEKEKITRARAAFRIFSQELNGSVVVVGNAPTALFELCELLEQGIKPALVIAAPVGFVGAKESKEEILRHDIPCIAVRGEKGGSTVAAAIANALIKIACAGGKLDNAPTALNQAQR